MKFSKWQLFSEVESAAISQQKGLYAFAISARPLTVFNVEDRAIVYFGMTNSKGGLRSRLRQFRSTLFEEKDGHGGALRFRFEHSKNLSKLRKCLYFAVCEYKAPSNHSAVDELKLMGEVAKAEYVAFARYFEKYGCLPKYNDMKRSPKK